MTEEELVSVQTSRTRKVVIGLLVLWLATFAALVAVAWNAYFQEKDKSQTLAEQIQSACNQGDLGRGLDPEDLEAGLSPEDEEALCDNADKVIEQNDPELQDNEIQESEIQEPEIQDPEFQDPETQDGEKQDAETQDSELQDSEEQDAEVQDPEIQDPENQDPEIDDPDPNDQIQSGSCTFDGQGTITFTFQTNNGPVTTQCTGTGGPTNPGNSSNRSK